MKHLKRILKYLFCALGLFLLGFAVYGATQVDFSDPEDLDEYLERKFIKSGVAGMAVTLIGDGQISYFRGFGYADIAEKREITADTVFQLASVSKTVTGTAAMQLYERGALDLDRDINAYLPFEIVNPYYPDVPITARMLLSHTSGILDNWDIYNSLYTIHSGGGDSDIKLKDFIAGYCLEGGTWYVKEKNFKNSEPGSFYEYSNCGYALLGYLVETISAQPFNEYCRDHIFQPLGMDHTGWFLSEVDIGKMAVPYENGRKLKALPLYGFPSYAGT